MFLFNFRAHRRRAFFYACVLAVFVVAVVRVPSLFFFGSSSSSPDATLVSSALSHLQVVPFRPRVLGYSREQFGAGWAMNVTPDGEYLDTRKIVLRRSASAPPHTEPVEGIDDYTGKPETTASMQIDHLYPLAAAWDMGAWSWSAGQRKTFANDVQRNLMATAGELNQEKSDSTPGQWLPPPREMIDDGRCHYVSLFLAVAVHYRLAISQSDADVAREVCRL